MVSLSRSVNMNEGGATFFDASTNTNDHTDLEPILESYGVFRPLRTIPLFTLHTLAALALEIAAIVFAVLHPDEKSRCKEYFILIYAHVGLWCLTFLLDQIAREKHYGLRLNGYLDLYTKTQFHRRFPLYVVSLWNAVILLLQAMMQYFYKDDFAEKCIKGGLLSPINYFGALMTLEFCLLTGINLKYILIVRKFNKQRPPPDVQREEWNACSHEHGFAQGEVGCRESGQKVFDFIEKQADMIRYLKDHNARLGEKLMVLSAQSRAQSC